MSELSPCQGDLHNSMQYAKYSLSTTSIIFNSITYTQHSVEGIGGGLTKQKGLYCRGAFENRETRKSKPSVGRKDYEFTINGFSTYNIGRPGLCRPFSRSSSSPFGPRLSGWKCWILMYLDIMRIKHELSASDVMASTECRNIIFSVTISNPSCLLYDLIKAKSQFKVHEILGCIIYTFDTQTHSHTHTHTTPSYAHTKFMSRGRMKTL
jgi:hypothetical protein